MVKGKCLICGLNKHRGGKGVWCTCEWQEEAQKGSCSQAQQFSSSAAAMNFPNMQNQILNPALNTGYFQPLSPFIPFPNVTHFDYQAEAASRECITPMPQIYYSDRAPDMGVGTSSSLTSAKDVVTMDKVTISNAKIIFTSPFEDCLALLLKIGITPFLIRSSTLAEELPRSLTLQEFVEQTAKKKAELVKSQMQDEKIEFDLIIACDTMISFDGKLIGKPTDDNDAFNILKSFDGRKHQVRTGICLISGKGKNILFSVQTEVEFGKNSDKLIWNCIRNGNSRNRVGGYSINGTGFALIEEVKGSWTNVIGLPIKVLEEKINEIL